MLESLPVVQFILSFRRRIKVSFHSVLLLLLEFGEVSEYLIITILTL